MAEQPASRGRRRKQRGSARFDATIHAGRGEKDLRRLDDMQLDRLPDRYGRVRVLVTAEECAQLLDLGYQVRLHGHQALEPLDPRLIATDESVQAWLDEIVSAAGESPEQSGREPA